MSLRLLEVALLLLLLATGDTSGQSKRGRLPPVTAIDHRRLMEMVKQDSGNVHVVNVWATWCDPCRKEIPALLKLRKELAQRGFGLIFVSADDPDNVDLEVRPTLERLGVDFPSYVVEDSTDEAFMSGMNPDWSGALPTSFIYDKHGRLVNMIVGGKTYRQFSDAITPLLGK